MSRLALLFVSHLLFSNASAPASRPSVDTVFDALARVRRFHDVAISPDGKRVAWSREASRPGRARVPRRDLRRGPASGRSRRLSAAPDGPACDEHGAAFSPDGAWIAFLSDAAREGPGADLDRPRGRRQRHVSSPASTASSTTSAGRPTAARSPFSSSRAPGRRPARSSPTSATRASSRRRSRSSASPSAPVRTGEVRLVSPANLYVYDYDWSADGKSFAAEAAEGSGTNNYWVARALPRRRGLGSGALDLEAAPPDRLPALLAGRQVRSPSSTAS